MAPRPVLHLLGVILLRRAAAQPFHFHDHDVVDDHHPEPPGPPPPCVDTSNGTVDEYGDGCEWYVCNPGGCGSHDDDDFSSSEMCCACYGSPANRSQAPVHPPRCVDTTLLEVAGYYDNGCHWYVDFPSDCGAFDAEDFSSSEMCCACGGGDEYVYEACGGSPAIRTPAPTPMPSAESTWDNHTQKKWGRSKIDRAVKKKDASRYVVPTSAFFLVCASGAFALSRYRSRRRLHRWASLGDGGRALARRYSLTRAPHPHSARTADHGGYEMLQVPEDDEERPSEACAPAPASQVTVGLDALAEVTGLGGAVHQLRPCSAPARRASLW